MSDNKLNEIPQWYYTLKESDELKEKDVYFLEPSEQEVIGGQYIPFAVFTQSNNLFDYLKNLKLLLNPDNLDVIYVTFNGETEIILTLEPSVEAILDFMNVYVETSRLLPPLSKFPEDALRLHEGSEPWKIDSPYAKKERFFIGMMKENNEDFEETGYTWEDVFSDLENSMISNDCLSGKLTSLSYFHEDTGIVETQAFTKFSGSLFSFMNNAAYGQVFFFIEVQYIPCNHNDIIKAWKELLGSQWANLPEDMPLDLFLAIVNTKEWTPLDQEALSNGIKDGDSNCLFQLCVMNDNLQEFEEVFLPLLEYMDEHIKDLMVKITRGRFPESKVLDKLTR